MTKYNEESIQRFAGLAGIRKKPTPYIGPTDGNGLWTIFREPADNAVDRALAGDNTLVHLVFDDVPNTYWVLDKGPGIPVGKKEFEDERGRKEKMSTLYVVTGLTHGGGNFSGDTISRGTHGVGIKATNAMSKFFKVWTFRDSSWWCIEYKDAKLSKEPYKTKAPKLPHGLKATGGTVVCFSPDLSLFHKGSKLNPKDPLGWAELTSYLVKGLEVKITNSKGKTKTFKTKGPAEYIVNKIAELKATQMGKSFVFSSKETDIAVAFTDVEGDNCVDAYTNGLHNKEGGEHVKALVDALVKSLVPYQGKNKYTPSDLKDGLLGLVNYKISAPQFNNQPKDKLIDGRVYEVAMPQMLKAWSEFWTAHKGMAKDVVARASLLRSKTADFLKDKKLVKNVNAARKNLATKLAPIQGKAPIEQRELFLVEGDSAGGGAKRARNKYTQAIYPLRGKPLNVMEAKKEKISGNAEVVGLLAALGIDLGGKRPNLEVPYGKIINMADPDVDGDHINVLLLGVLWQYLPSLFRDGKVFVVKAPLYKSRHKGVLYFGMNKEEVFKKAGTTKCDVTYIKGWGELSESDLGIALDPSVRMLYKVMPPDKKGANNFKLLLG